METIKELMLLAILAVLGLMACIAFALPTIIAFFRKHHYQWVIFAINTVFGATGFGYLIALVWAVWPKSTTLSDPVINDVTTNKKNADSETEDLDEDEEAAEIKNPKKVVRKRFQLRYPSNWEINVDDEDYDPDQMFSIDSPGTSYVMFIMGEMETDPAENLQDQIDEFSKLLGAPKVERFKTFGEYSGKGAILKGKILGSKTTVKAFSCFVDGMTAIIVQQHPDEDLQYVKDGLNLIEKSFTIKSNKKQKTPDN